MKLDKVKKLLFAFALLLTSAVFADDLTHDSISFTLKSETQSIQADSPFWIALDLEIEPGWHAYWKNPGEAGMAPQLEWTLPEGFNVQALEWPYPSRFNLGEATAFGYSNKAILLAKIAPPSKLTQDRAEIKVDLKWVVCNDETCLPGFSTDSLSLTISDEAPQIKSEEAAYFEEARGHIPKKSVPLKTEQKQSIVETLLDAQDASETEVAEADFFPERHGVSRKVKVAVSQEPEKGSQVKLSYSIDPSGEPLKGVLVVGKKAYELHIETPQAATQTEITSFALALLFAFLGGMILNLMPCVLPVVSLKVLSFVNLAKESSWHRVQHGLMFTLGVLVSFWVLAALLLILQAWGQAVGWGFQLQNPLFVAALASLMLIFALSLFGVFEMGALFASWAGERESRTKEGPLSAFFSGVLATAVATPCTGPFLGSAIGYAFTLPPLGSLTIFTFLALGMALPYLLLTSYPPLLRFVPKPGKWMETFKQAMGFLMLLAALWLTWVFASETVEPASTLLLAAFFVIGLLCWILGKWGTPVSSTLSRLLSGGIALILLAGTFKLLFIASSLDSKREIVLLDEEWEPFSIERVEKLRSQGTPVFVDFTAKWCLICQTNHLVLSSPPVQSKMKEKGVVKMKADWTKNDPEITAELKKWGRSGVPLYLLYGKDDAKILPQLLTPDNVIASLDEIGNEIDRAD